MKHPGIQKIIDKLKTIESDQFNMKEAGYWNFGNDKYVGCSTPCCIGGWCRIILKNEGFDIHEMNVQHAIIAVDNSVRFHHATSIAYPLDIEDWEEITIPMSIEVLEIFRDTGEVKWLEVYNKHQSSIVQWLNENSVFGLEYE